MLHVATLLAVLGSQFVIDASKSRAEFTVTHVFFERVTGTVPIVSGTVVLREGSLVPVSVSAVLDPTKIKTGDDDGDGALQAPDWFDTRKFPTWTFESTQITPAGKDAFTMEGLLMIHGVAQSERLDVTIGGTTEHPAYRALTHVDRHAFGMSTTRLDPAIGNTVDVTLDVALK